MAHSSTIVSTDELAAHLDDPQWVVFDCRFTLTDPGAGQTAYVQAHIPGARYAHLDNDLSSPKNEHSGRHPLPDPAALAEKLGQWGVGEHTQVVVYDDSFGAIAVRLWWLLRWLGHDAVALLDGGLPKWQREGKPMTPQVPDMRPTIFSARPNHAMWVDAQDVRKALEHKQAILLDARAEVRFTGDREPIDPVAGHIPGAINLPFEDNLDLGGNLLPPAALRKFYQGILQGHPASQVIHMCGSGITACHNILAMEMAGLTGAKLYPGSWSEWISDPTRPIATGE
jgi:thiosulfate/3-mercaptopyruvate sulfurtransferase